MPRSSRRQHRSLRYLSGFDNLNLIYWFFVKTITWTHDARREFCKLPPEVRADIEAKIERFAKTGAGNVKRLRDRQGARLRVGDWRVIFVETSTTVEVRAVGNRRDIYR